MFNINDFLMKTIKGMIGNYPDFQVREYALGWWSKGKLSEDDLASIDALIEEQYAVPPVVELPTDESEIEDETILDETEGTETVVEGTEEVTEIVEDSTNEESIETEAEPLEETE